MAQHQAAPPGAPPPKTPLADDIANAPRPSTLFVPLQGYPGRLLIIVDRQCTSGDERWPQIIYGICRTQKRDHALTSYLLPTMPLPTHRNQAGACSELRPCIQTSDELERWQPHHTPSGVQRRGTRCGLGAEAQYRQPPTSRHDCHPSGWYG